MVAAEQIQEQKLIALARQIDLLQVEFAREAASYAASRQHEVDGFISPIDWLRFNCHLTGPAAANAVAVGERLDRLSASVAKLYSSELGYAHLVVLARTAQATGQAFDEQDLLEKAVESSPGKLHYICRHYRHARNPGAHAGEESDLHEQRYLKIATSPDGGISLSGYLDPVDGEVVRSALEPLARKDGADDRRVRDQRMADALVEAVTGAGIHTSIQVTASAETLASIAGCPAADLRYGLPVSAETLRQLACDCSITRVLLNSESQVIDVGRARRLPSAPMRRALEARDGGCRWPDCDRPAKWSAAHHLQHWAKQGPTDLDNLVLLCHRHHTLVHRGGWQVARSEGGKLLTIPPTVRFDRHDRGPD